MSKYAPRPREACALVGGLLVRGRDCRRPAPLPPGNTVSQVLAYSWRLRAMRCMSAVKVTQGRAQPQAAAIMLCYCFHPSPLSSPHATHQTALFLGVGLKPRAIKWPAWPRSPACRVPRDKNERNYLRASTK